MEGGTSRGYTIAHSSAMEQNARSGTRRPRPAPSPPPRVFPPLPPLSPPGADESQLSKTPPPAGAWSERLGGKSADVVRADAAAYNVEKEPPPAVATVVSRCYQQLGPRHFALKESPREEKEENSGDESVWRPAPNGDNAAQAGEGGPFPALARKSAPPPIVGQSVTHFGRTIWSVTPEELSALEEEMIATKMQSIDAARKLSYAEASRRNLPLFADNQAAQKKEAVDVEQPRRTFKRYYGLPIFTSAGHHD
ncbi:unnamed protein product [Phytophthora fragariaefolia]|uniref:Unnamed protein product n=1 Tax=Phytophthora fragariaefolia TaxID=1490495 RepID=A0A9W6Y8K7_9STRA|nr:unnamed protein product [Phytophthora fragariaefolia]